MEWSEDFESGLPEIDGYHRQVFALIERVRDGVECSVVREVLVMLEQLTREHFGFEQQIMVDYAYPGMARHTAEHGLLLRELQGYLDSTAYSPRRLNLVLRNWLQSHTMMDDRRLAQHVLELRTAELRTRLGQEAMEKEASPQSGVRSNLDNQVERASGE